MLGIVIGAGAVLGAGTQATITADDAVAIQREVPLVEGAAPYSATTPKSCPVIGVLDRKSQTTSGYDQDDEINWDSTRPTA